MDAKSSATIQAFKQKLNKRSYNTISQQQALTTKDIPAKGPMWVSRATFHTALDYRARSIVFNAIQGLGNGEEVYASPSLSNVEGEWVGFRGGVGMTEGEPDISEKDKYTSLMQETRSKLTMLYIHGGTFR